MGLKSSLKTKLQCFQGLQSLPDLCQRPLAYVQAIGWCFVVGPQVAVDVDAVKWSMCHNRTPFFASALSSLKLAMTRNEDNSGKFLSCGSPDELDVN